MSAGSCPGTGHVVLDEARRPVACGKADCPSCGRWVATNAHGRLYRHTAGRPRSARTCLVLAVGPRR